MAITGSNNPDTLLGTVLADVLSALGSDDLLFGYDGNDLLFGGDGDDFLMVARVTTPWSAGRVKTSFMASLAMTWCPMLRLQLG